MYQSLESDAWVITDNCAKLIECIPQLVPHERRHEDISQGGRAILPTPRAMDWSPAEGSPVLRPRSAGL